MTLPPQLSGALPHAPPRSVGASPLPPHLVWRRLGAPPYPRRSSLFLLNGGMATYRADLQRLLLAHNRRRVAAGKDDEASAACRTFLVAAVTAWASAPSPERVLACRLARKYKGGDGPAMGNLRSADRRLADLLRGLIDTTGVPLLDVSVATVTKAEEGPSEYEMNASWGQGRANNKPFNMTNSQAKRLYWDKYRRGGFAGSGCCVGEGDSDGEGEVEESHELLQVDSRTVSTSWSDGGTAPGVPATVWKRLQLEVPKEMLNIGWGTAFDAAHSDEEYEPTGGGCMGTPRVTHTSSFAALVLWPRACRDTLVNLPDSDEEGGGRQRRGVGGWRQR